MEGEQLHPVRDAEGVHLFAESEVLRVARELRNNAGTSQRVSAQSDWFKRQTAQREPEREETESLRERVRALESDATALRTDNLRLQSLERERAQRESRVTEEARLEAERRTLEEQTAVVRLLDELESLTPRQLRRFLREEPDLVEDLDELLSL